MHLVQWQGRREKSGGAAGHFCGYLCEAGFEAADTAMKQQEFSCTLPDSNTVARVV